MEYEDDDAQAATLTIDWVGDTEHGMLPTLRVDNWDDLGGELTDAVQAYNQLVDRIWDEGGQTGSYYWAAQPYLGAAEGFPGVLATLRRAATGVNPDVERLCEEIQNWVSTVSDYLATPVPDGWISPDLDNTPGSRATVYSPMPPVPEYTDEPGGTYDSGYDPQEKEHERPRGWQGRPGEGDDGGKGKERQRPQDDWSDREGTDDDRPGDDRADFRIAGTYQLRVPDEAGQPDRLAERVMQYNASVADLDPTYVEGVLQGTPMRADRPLDNATFDEPMALLGEVRAKARAGGWASRDGFLDSVDELAALLARHAGDDPGSDSDDDSDDDFDPATDDVELPGAPRRGLFRR
jgi:hypothetical protein